MTDVSNAPQEPRDVPCPWPDVLNGACRNHILHPEEFSCTRCKGAKSLPEFERAPKANAKIGDWIDFAVATGADQGYASSRSREELAEEFGARLSAPEPVQVADPTAPDEVTPSDGPARTTAPAGVIPTVPVRRK